MYEEEVDGPASESECGLDGYLDKYLDADGGDAGSGNGQGTGGNSKIEGGEAGMRLRRVDDSFTFVQMNNESDDEKSLCVALGRRVALVALRLSGNPGDTSH